jgi:type I restriction enzyme S subunit
MSATKGHVYRLKTSAYVVNHLAALVPHMSEDSEFLVRVLQRFSPTTLIKDEAYPSIRLGDIERMKVMVPPDPAGRRRIAEILDKADALRAKRRAALAQLDTLTQSIFVDMFGDPATNPKGWPVVAIADICEVKGGKRLPKGEEYSATPTPFRYIRVTDIQSGAVDEAALVYLKPEIQAEISRYIVNTGDVIISIAGSIGLVAPVPASLDGANLTENAAKLVPREKGIYDEVFLAAFLQTSFAQGQIAAHVGQVTIGKLALFRIEKIRVPLPPLGTQHRFAEFTTAIARQRATHREASAELDALFGSLQHRAFQGEL